MNSEETTQTAWSLEEQRLGNRMGEGQKLAAALLTAAEKAVLGLAVISSLVG